MKFKVKGLVFVGFAAAILSANAMAADENVVTSKSFTEATYQKKIGGRADQLAVTTSTAGVVTYKDIATSSSGVTAGAATIPTSGAVADAIASASQVSNFIEDSVTDNVTNKAPTENAVYDYVTVKGVKLGNDTALTPSNDAAKVVTIPDMTGADGTVAGTHGLVPAPTATDHTKFLKGDGTWTTIDSEAYTGTGAIDVTNHVISASTMTGTDGTSAGNAGLVPAQATTDAGKFLKANGNWTTALENVQVNGTDLTPDSSNKVNVTIAQGSADGTIAVNGADVSVKNAEVTTNKVTSMSGSSTDTQYPSAKAVYDAIQTATGGLTIPGKNASVCNDTTPCALVAETDGLHWRTMATANNAGGVCGDASGNCVDPVSGD